MKNKIFKHKQTTQFFNNLITRNNQYETRHKIISNQNIHKLAINTLRLNRFTNFQTINSILEYSNISSIEIAWELLAIVIKHKKILKLLLKLSGLQQVVRQDTLLELSLYHIKYDEIGNAYERLTSFIPIHPYSENPLLVGYTGIIAYMLYQQTSISN